MGGSAGMRAGDSYAKMKKEYSGGARRGWCVGPTAAGSEHGGETRVPRSRDGGGAHVYRIIFSGAPVRVTSVGSPGKCRSWSPAGWWGTRSAVAVSSGGQPRAEDRGRRFSALENAR